MPSQSARTTRPHLSGGLALAVLLLLGWPPPSLTAQEGGQGGGVLGERVRVTMLGETEPFSGTLLSVGRDSLTLEVVPGTQTRVARAEVGSLERSLGHQNRVLRGLMVGSLSGFAVGGITGLVLNSAISDSGLSESDPTGAFFKGAALYAALGGFIGTLVGWARSGEAWEEVPVGDGWTATLRVGPSGTGLQVGFSLSQPRGGPR